MKFLSDIGANDPPFFLLVVLVLVPIISIILLPATFVCPNNHDTGEVPISGTMGGIYLQFYERAGVTFDEYGEYRYAIELDIEYKAESLSSFKDKVHLESLVHQKVMRAKNAVNDQHFRKLVNEMLGRKITFADVFFNKVKASYIKSEMDDALRELMQKKIDQSGFIREVKITLTKVK